MALTNATGDVWQVGFATSAIYLRPNNRAVRGGPSAPAPRGRARRGGRR